MTLTLSSSTRIAAYGYDAATQILAIKFRAGPGGKTYHYANVPPALYAEFEQADSKGKFFQEHIKDAKNADGIPRYPYTLMEPGEEDEEDVTGPPEPAPKKEEKPAPEQVPPEPAKEKA